MKRKSTIRKMRGMPISRDIYRTIAQAQASIKRLEKLAIHVERLELDSAALAVARRTRLPGIETAVAMAQPELGDIPVKDTWDETVAEWLK